MQQQQQQLSPGQPHNYFTEANNVRVTGCSSELSNATAANLLSDIRKNIWMSDEGLPQFITFDISKMISRPKFFKSIAFDCWHDYKTNPAAIQLLVSTDPSKDYITWSSLYLEQREGVQKFSIDPLGVRYGYIKILIKETFGAAKTYLNSISLFEESVSSKGSATVGNIPPNTQNGNTSGILRRKHSNGSDISMNIDVDLDASKYASNPNFNSNNKHSGSVSKLGQRSARSSASVSSIQHQQILQQNQTVQDYSPIIPLNYVSQPTPTGGLFNMTAPAGTMLGISSTPVQQQQQQQQQQQKPLQMSQYFNRPSLQSSPAEEKQPQSIARSHLHQSMQLTRSSQVSQHQFQPQNEFVQKQLFNISNNNNSSNPMKGSMTKINYVQENQQQQQQTFYQQDDDHIEHQGQQIKQTIIATDQETKAEIFELKKIVNVLLQDRSEREERLRRLEQVCEQLSFTCSTLSDKVQELEAQNFLKTQTTVPPKVYEPQLVGQQKIFEDEKQIDQIRSNPIRMQLDTEIGIERDSGLRSSFQGKQLTMQSQQQQFNSQPSQKSPKTLASNASAFGLNKQSQTRQSKKSLTSSPSVKNTIENQETDVMQDKIAQIIDSRLSKLTKAIATGEFLQNQPSEREERPQVQTEKRRPQSIQKHKEIVEPSENNTQFNQKEGRIDRQNYDSTRSNQQNQQRHPREPSTNLAKRMHSYEDEEEGEVESRVAQRREDGNLKTVKNRSSKPAADSETLKQRESNQQRVVTQPRYEDIDLAGIKHEQGSGNPRVMKLLERLQEKLTIRQKKVDQLSSGTKVKRNNSLHRVDM